MDFIPNLPEKLLSSSELTLFFSKASIGYSIDTDLLKGLNTTIYTQLYKLFEYMYFIHISYLEPTIE